MQKGLIGLLMLSWVATACGAGQTAESAPPPTPPPPPPATTAAPPPPAPEPPPAPKLTMTEMQQKYVEGAKAAWGAHDAKTLAALYAEDAVLGYPAMEGWRDSPGRASLEKNMADFFTAFPDAKVTHHRVYHVGDVLIMEWLLNGTQQGDFMGQKASGKRLGYHGASVLWFSDDGLVKREHMYFDHGTFMAQLGFAPKGVQGRPVDEAAAEAKTEWVVAAGSDAEKKNGEAVSTFTGTYEKKDIKTFADLLTEDATKVNYARPSDPPLGKLTGRELAKKMTSEVYKAMPDAKWTTTNQWAAGDYVIVEGALTATFKGALGPIKPTNKTGTVHSLDVVKLKDGKLGQVFSYGSSAEFANAFGLMPKPPAAAKAPAPPAKPATGAAPATPAKPATGAAPATPAKPATGAAPAMPAKPATGAAPATPAKPAAPAAPASPKTP